MKDDEKITIEGAVVRSLIMAHVAKLGFKINEMTIVFDTDSRGPIPISFNEVLSVSASGHRPKGTGLEGGK